MGLLDQVIGAAGGLFGQHEAGENSLPGAIMSLLNNPQGGGIEGLIRSFEQGGLGETAKSWVSTGENLPISATQIESVIGSEQIQNFASKLGIDPNQASAKLAEYLPQVIDKLSPDGTLPAGENLATQGLEFLKGKLFG